MVQLACSFLNLITPNGIGGTALQIDYLHHQDVPIASAGSAMVLSTGVGGAIQMILFLIAAAITATSLDSYDTGGSVTLGAIAVVAALIGDHPVDPQGPQQGHARGEEGGERHLGGAPQPEERADLRQAHRTTPVPALRGTGVVRSGGRARERARHPQTGARRGYRRVHPCPEAEHATDAGLARCVAPAGNLTRRGSGNVPSAPRPHRRPLSGPAAGYRRVAASERSKLTSELVALVWWTSTARVFDPFTSADVGTV